MSPLIKHGKIIVEKPGAIIEMTRKVNPVHGLASEDEGSAID